MSYARNFTLKTSLIKMKNTFINFIQTEISEKKQFV